MADIDAVLIDERLFEIEDVAEIRDLVAVGFPHFPAFDQVEHHPAEVISRMNRPAVKNRLRHQPELFQSEIANALEQLGAADVGPLVVGAVRLRSAQVQLRAPERAKQKAVRVRMVSQPLRGSFLGCAHSFIHTRTSGFTQDALASPRRRRPSSPC